MAPNALARHGLAQSGLVRPDLAQPGLAQPEQEPTAAAIPLGSSHWARVQNQSKSHKSCLGSRPKRQYAQSAACAQASAQQSLRGSSLRYPGHAAAVASALLRVGRIRVERREGRRTAAGRYDSISETAHMQLQPLQPAAELSNARLLQCQQRAANQPNVAASSL